MAMVAGLFASETNNVGAVHGGSMTALFELGPLGGTGLPEDVVTNIESQDADPGPDWTELFDEDGVIDENNDKRPDVGGEAATFIADDLALSGGVDRTVFASSNKNGDTIGSWNWNTGNAPAKDDLSNVYAYATRNDQNDLVIFAGMERISANGDSHVDIEFNQDAITLDEEPPDEGVIPTCGTAGGSGDPPCEFVGGDKRENDFIVSIDFTNGGTLGTLEVRKWMGPAATGSYVVVGSAPTQGCNTNAGLAEDAFCGFSNGAPIDSGPWTTFNTKGQIETLATNAFAEFGINITDALEGQTPCFATFSAHTRTSASFSSELKDFAIANFQVCRPDTQLVLHSYKIGSTTEVSTSTQASPTIVVHHGESLTLTFAETNLGNFPLQKPSGNATGLNQFVVIRDANQKLACSPTDVVSAGFNVGDTNQNNVLDPAMGANLPESWKYSCTFTVVADSDSMTTNTPTTFTAYGHGIDLLTSPGTRKDVTSCQSVGPPPVQDPQNLILLPATTVTCDQDETITVNLRSPSTAVTASVTVTYTFFETNDGTVPLTKPFDRNFVGTSGTNPCDSFAPVPATGLNVGDVPPLANGILDPGETWQFTCTKTLGGTSGTTSGGSVTFGTGHGIDSTNSDVTFCTAVGPPPTAFEPAKVDGTTTATPACDPEERRKVTVTIE